MRKNRRQQGISVIDTLGALAIVTMLLLGVSAMIDSSLDDVKGQQAARHQEQVVNAASKYISANYADLVASTAGGTTATITIAQLTESGRLPVKQLFQYQYLQPDTMRPRPATRLRQA